MEFYFNITERGPDIHWTRVPVSKYPLAWAEGRILLALQHAGLLVLGLITGQSAIPWLAPQEHSRTAEVVYLLLSHFANRRDPHQTPPPTGGAGTSGVLRFDNWRRSRIVLLDLRIFARRDDSAREPSKPGGTANAPRADS